MDPLVPRVIHRYAASVSDNPAKWESKTKAFSPTKYSRTKLFKEFTLHWRPVRGGFAEIEATLGLRVVASLFYGPWNMEDPTALEGAIEVDPQFRRQGLASAMYDWGEKLSGLTFKPAEGHTPAAEAFWQARLRRH